MNRVSKAVLMAPLVAVALVAAGTASAQDKADRKERVEQFNKRFTEADANSDGKLTRDEAQSKMPYVASHFDEIDTDKKGYVTKQDVAKMMKKAGAAKGQ